MKLTKIEKVWALSIFDYFFPSQKNPTLSIGVKDLPFEKYLDDFFVNSPAHTTAGVRLGLIAMQIMPFIFIKKFKLFKNLNEDEKEIYLEKWIKNKIYLIRQIALFVKMFGVFGYCGFPEVQRQMGIVKEKQTPPI